MIDAISLEVFRHLFASVAEEMGVTLQRAAFSPNIRERLDYSCAVFDAEARLVAQAAHIPVHLGSMPASVAEAVAAFDDFVPGDVVALNDPYRGGSHLPDITMVSPVFVDGDIVFYVASRAHHADVGGMSPGSLPLSTELYQEGVIIPPIKLLDAGKRNEAALALIAANSRSSQERIGDLEAQLAAHRAGAGRLRAIVAKHGRTRVLEHADSLMDYARRVTQAVIEAMPDGVYTFEDALESDGQTHAPIPIRVAITVNGNAMTVDFAGTAPQVAGNVNTVEANVRSATWYCVRLLADADPPVNHGCFEPVSVVVPARTVLNPAFPAAVAVGNTETSQRVTDVVLGALAMALPDRVPAASQGSMNNVTIGGDGFVYYETIGGGGGGGPRGAGLSGLHSHMTNTRNTPVEAIEYGLPLRVLTYALREGSGGAGEHPGGEGVRREIEFLASATVTLNCERRERPPYGLNGGEPGALGRNTLLRNDTEQNLGGRWTGRVNAGDVLIVETPGGGGWGK